MLQYVVRLLLLILPVQLAVQRGSVLWILPVLRVLRHSSMYQVSSTFRAASTESIAVVPAAEML